MQRALLFVLLLLPQIASAEAWGINDFTNSNINLGSKPLRETIGGVVNIVLGFLGILATLGIIIGGFVMMTSGGNAEKSQSGKNGVTAGLIGLIIVLTAYAISRFVLGSLYNETVQP